MAANNILIYYQNCRGIRTKLQTLYMNILSHSYDVIILTETWLVPTISDNEFIDDRYLVFRYDRNRIATKKGEGGGVLVAVLRELRPCLIKAQHNMCSAVEQVTVWLPASRRLRHHVISAVYIPPRTCEEAYVEYFSMLQGLADGASTDAFFIVGDFNIPDIDWLIQGNHAVARTLSSSIGRILINFMSLVNGLQYNTTLNKLGRILDLLISNIDCLKVPCTALLELDSHHPPFSTLTSLNMNFSPMTSRSSKRYNFYKADYEGINNNLQDVNWNMLLNHLSSEQAVGVFYEVLYGIVRSYVPLTRIKCPNYPAWFPPSLIRIFKSKEHAWIRWKKYRNQSDYLQFSSYRTLFRKECSKCYRNYIYSVEDSIPKNIKNFWAFVSNRKSSSSIPATMYLRNASSSDAAVICNLFSSHFSSVYEPSTFDPNEWLPNNVYADKASCLSDIYLSKEAILLQLKSLDLTKGAGPDGLPPRFLKNTSENLCTALHIILNKCLSEGNFPSIWKRAFITPVHKDGDKANVENYRPISILSTLSKVFESLVHGVLYPQIHQIIMPEQHGFVKRRSTTTNLMVFSNCLFENMDRRVQVDTVYTDFQKAFDKVDHELLMEKIAFNGIRGNLLRWFASYISNRSQVVVIKGYESDSIVVTSGVPQGSILGPLLFVLFINDIKKCFLNSHCLLYADDMKIYRPCKNILDCLLLQDDLDRLNLYCAHNKLFLSIPKCHCITFTKNKYKINFNYSINGVYLNRTDLVRDLGVTFDSRLHFDVHVDNVINKAFQMFGFVMRSSRDFVRSSTFLLLYKTLIRSQLEYAVSIWHPYYEIYKSRLEMVQKKFLRSVNYKFYRSTIPYKDSLTRYGILSLEARRLLLGATMLHGLCNNRFDSIAITNKICYIVPRTVIRRAARVPSLFCTDTCRTNAGMRAPLRRLVDAYNTFFTQLDIFSLTHQQFKYRAIELLKSI